MPSTLRAFIGVKIECPPGLSDILRTLGTMGNAVRVTDLNSLHITVKFLGDTDWEQTAAIARELEAAAREAPAHEAELRGLGAFPAPARPTVIWAGVRPEGPPVRLAADLDRRLSAHGFVPEARPYHPHLTLARVKFRPPDSLRTILDQLADEDFGDVAIESVALYQSEQSRAGPKYTPLATAELQG